MTQMTPPEIVSELDKHIVGQGKAKRAVAIALRNRWRRAQVTARWAVMSGDEICTTLGAKSARSRFTRPGNVSMVETLVTLAASGRLGMTDVDHVLFMYDAEGLELPLDFVYAMGGDLLDAQTWLEGKKQRLAQAAAADAAPDTPVMQSDSQL